MLDAERLEQARFALSQDAFEIYASDARALGLSGSGRGWIRRLSLPDWRPATHPPAGDVVKAAWLSLVVELTQLLSVDWLTPLHTISEAESKLLQYRCAADLGIGTPRTVVASERDLIPTEFGDPVIVKPLGPAQFTDERGEPRVVFTTELARAAPELDELGGAPFLVQERVRATRHLRIVTVRQESWVCALEAADLPVDWRIVEEAHHAFAPSEAFADTAASAVELASAMGVGYSSQDWIVTDEGAFFVDLNPAGQWLFLPDPVASEVTGAIASWLVAE